jgi:hypothetical protein
VSSKPYTLATLPPEGTPDILEQDAGWIPEQVWTFGEEKNLILARIRHWIVQPVAKSHYTNYAILIPVAGVV